MERMSSRGSYDSAASGSNVFSVNTPTGTTSDESWDSNGSRKGSASIDYKLMGSNGTEETAIFHHLSNETRPPTREHVIHLSNLEQCMPRAYIRVCLAYRLPPEAVLEEVIQKLRNLSRKLIDSKPYLAGYVTPYLVDGKVGPPEIRFSDQDFLEFPEVEVRYLTHEEVPYTYDELDKQCLPPSIIRPDLISALPEGTGNERAPVFRMQANIVEGGIIVSVYLHHCISDGVGMGLLITGSVLQDDFTFDRHLDAKGYAASLNIRLDEFSNQKSILRQKLSWSFPNQISNRNISYKSMSRAASFSFSDRPPGRGSVIAFSRRKLEDLKDLLMVHMPNCFMSPNDVLQALLWHHMTIARKPALTDLVVMSKLLIPVNIRNKLKEPLPESYFGAAVDFVTAQLPLSHLSPYDPISPVALAETAIAIRHAINSMDEQYIRQVIALARHPDTDIDVRDLMGSNMNRAEGADMYITSWERLGLYDAALELGLGKPDWVRKPWSKDPGSCIILPNDDRKDYIEVVVQMTVNDMERLLADNVFRQYVIRTID